MQDVGRGRLHPFVHSWSPTIGVLDFQIGLVSGHGPAALGHVPPRKIHSTRSPGGLAPPCCSYRHISLNYLSYVSILDPDDIWIRLEFVLWALSGVALELSSDEAVRVVELVGFGRLPVNSTGGL